MKNFKPLYKDIHKLLRRTSLFDPFERMFFTRNFDFDRFDKPYPSRKQLFNKDKKTENDKADSQAITKENKEPRNFSWEETREVFTPFGKKNIKTKVEEKEVKNDNYHSYTYSKTTSSFFHPWDSVEVKDEKNKENKEIKEGKGEKAAEKNEKLPDNVEEIDKQEKIVFENGKKKRIVTTKKTMKDGSMITEINEKFI